MEKIILHTSFKDLKALSSSVVEFLADNFGVGQEEIYGNFHLSMTDDLGIDGDDGDELIAKFSEKYKVDFSEFEYDKYFSPEGIDIVMIPFVVLILALFIINCLLTLIFMCLNRQNPLKKSFSTLFNKRSERQLTVGDLIVSAHQGKFMKREEVYFVLN
jgi:Protein of unknown function (DUF1493)